MLIRSFSTVLGGDVLSRAAVLCTTFIAVRALTPADFGLYVALYATALVAAAAWDLGLSIVISRAVASSLGGAWPAFRRGCTLRLAGLPIWLLVWALGIVIASSFEARSTSVVLPFLVASAASGLAILALAAIRGAQRFGSAAVAQSAGKWVTAVVSLFAFTADSPRDRLVVLGVAFAVGELTLLFCAAAALVGHRAAPDALVADSITYRAALPFAANSVMSMTYNRFDVVLVGGLASPVAAGIYGAASRAQDALYSVSGALGSIALPKLSAVPAGPEAASERQRLIVRFWVMGLMLTIPIVALVIVVAPWLVPAVLGEDYRASITPLRILVCFLPFAIVQAPLLAGLAAIGEGAQTTLIIGVTLCVAVLLQVILAPRYGATGAAAASLGRDIVATPLALVVGARKGLVPRSVTVRRSSSTS